MQRHKKFLRRSLSPLVFYKFLSTTQPLSNFYGFDRGIPIDRYYIEDFLEKNKHHVHGACLELLNNSYTKRYGSSKVTKSDILDIDASNQDATIIDDLRDLTDIADNTYDCIILTQVLQFIDDKEAAVKECFRILKQDGVLLATVPSLSRADCVSGTEDDFWRFTQAGAHYLFEKYFKDPTVVPRGNVRTGMYFYAGATLEEISKKILEIDDPNFPTIITIKARK